MSHVFISYARDDHQVAVLVQEQLERSGFNVWLHRPETRDIQDWQTSVTQAIIDSFAVIIVITLRAVTSSFVEDVWNVADGLNKRVVPLVFENAEPLFVRYHAAGEMDFTDPPSYPWRLLVQRLIRAAQVALNTQPPEVVPPEAVRRGARRLFETDELPALPDDDETTQQIPVRLRSLKKDTAPEPIPEPAAEIAGEVAPQAAADAPTEVGLDAAPKPAAPAPPPPAQAAEKEPPEAKPEAPVELAEVHFTAFGPKEAAVETWYTLLAYAHVAEALDRVRADADRSRPEMGSMPHMVSNSTPARLARGAEITIVPSAEGITFNPDRLTFRWLEDLHRADFRFKADKKLSGTAANVLITIYVGPLIAAALKMGMLLLEPGEVPQTIPDNAAVTGNLYRAEQIFVSYSHADAPVVRACRNAYKALGYDVLIDVDTLRAGQNWNDELMRLIDRATIFQLFWSEHAAMSAYVRREWEYALKKNSGTGEGFIRPVHWEDPLVTPPAELSRLHFVYISLPRLVRG
jgi:hypothetical protein